MASAEEAPLVGQLPLRKTSGFSVFMERYGPFAFVIMWIGLGVTGGCLMEGWRPLTGLYVIVQIVTTIGYGDLCFQTDVGKVFVAVYILVTLCAIAGYIIDTASEFLNEASSGLLKQKVFDAQVKAQKSVIASIPSAWRKAARDFVIFASFIVAGMCFLRLCESCTCSYGKTFIEGCEEGEKCEETGGAIKTWMNTFYMAVVTLTTVGFGDHTPKSYYGRLFAVPWMLFGVIATGNFISSFGAAMKAKRAKEEQAKQASSSIFAEMKVDQEGAMTLNEFRFYALRKFGKVSEADLADIDALFKLIDVDSSGSLSNSEVQAFMDK